MSFEIEPGEAMGYIGPNGTENSTTIKMLTGILVPTNGEARGLGATPPATIWNTSAIRRSTSSS